MPKRPFLAGFAGETVAAFRHGPGGSSGLRPSLGLVLGLSLAGCGTTIDETVTAPGALTERPATIRNEQLIGKWGVASFREEKDRKRVEAMARTQCRLPYVIAKGPSNGVMMHVADDAKLYELRIKGGSDGKTYLGREAPPGDWQDREILSLTDKEMMMRFVDAEAHGRYGTFIYIRCPG
jgi:hypothetical protein